MIDLSRLPMAAMLVDGRRCVLEANDAAHDLFDVGSLEARLLDELVADIVLDDAAPRRSIISGTSREVLIRVSPAEGESPALLIIDEPSADPTAAQTISMVSHELRSPLTSLRGFVGLLRSRWDRIDDAQRREILDQIDIDADRVARLLTELLDITRLDAGGLRLRPERVELAPLVSSLVDRLELTNPGLTCDVRFEADLPELFADRGKVEQILVNLIENAKKYGSAEVTLGAEVHGSMLRVEVGDNGPGVAAHDRDRIFERFYRHDQGRPDGLGLGLFISRALAEAHEGALTLAPNDGLGARFWLTLPLVPDPTLAV